MTKEGYMTTTDARGWIDALIKAMHEETSGSWPDPEYKDEVYSALEMAIQSLSQEPNGYVNIAKDLIDDEEDSIFYQEPCEDVVSRDAVIKAVDAHTNEDGTLDDDISVILEDLPSVTQKSGKWLITHLSNMAYCSECDYLFKDIPASIVEHFKHCPDCGCRMVATHESEDKE